jgi:DNA polymerase I
MYLDYKNGLNNCLNFQIQGLSASIVNRAMIEIQKYFNDNNIDAWVCATVHDQIIVNAPEHLAKDLAPKIEEFMCQTTKLSVELSAPPAIAENWYDSH